MARRTYDDPGPEPTARPTERLLGEEEDEKVVPMTNVGGAAPTARGLDSGGDFPGPEDDLANLPEPEPPDAPEVSAIHVADEDELDEAGDDRQ
jgi:hypothetical protein